MNDIETQTAFLKEIENFEPRGLKYAQVPCVLFYGNDKPNTDINCLVDVLEIRDSD